MNIWLKCALIRAIKTMAQTAVALIGTGSMGILEVDWISVCSASALAGVMSLLTSIAGLPEVKMQCLLDEEIYAEDTHDGEETD